MPLISPQDLIIPAVKAIFALWQMWLVIGVVALVKLGYRLWDKNRLKKSGIGEIDHMDGKTFEKYLKVLFENLGYRVERTPYIGDYGADLVTYKDGVKTVIQAKRHKNKVNIKAVQEAVAAKGKYGCSEAMVVTNSFYTKAAVELAKANRVELWNRDHLVKALLSIKKDSAVPEEQQKAAETPEQQVAGEKDTCVICGKSVTGKVKQYCLANQNRFGGNIYCYDHQRNQ